MYKYGINTTPKPMKDQDKALYYAAVHDGNITACIHALRHQKKLIYITDPPYYKMVEESVGEKYYRRNAKRPVYHETAAHGAASNGDKDIVSLLFEYGWMPGEVDKDGSTVAQWAEAGQYHILKEWIEMMERTRLAKLQLQKLKEGNIKKEQKKLNGIMKKQTSQYKVNQKGRSHGHYI